MDKELVQIVSLIVMGEEAPRMYVTKTIDFSEATFSFRQEGSQNTLTFPLRSFLMSEEMPKSNLDSLESKEETSELVK